MWKCGGTNNYEKQGTLKEEEWASYERSQQYCRKSWIFNNFLGKKIMSWKYLEDKQWDKFGIVISYRLGYVFCHLFDENLGNLYYFVWINVLLSLFLSPIANFILSSLLVSFLFLSHFTLWMCAFAVFQVQVGIQAGSNVKTKEKQTKSEIWWHGLVALLRPPVAHATGRSRKP